MSQAQTMKAKHHQPERVQVDNIKAAVANPTPVAGNTTVQAGAAAVATAMGWTVGQAALFLQTGQEPLSPV